MGFFIYRPVALKSEVVDQAAPITNPLPPSTPKTHLPAVLPERSAPLSVRWSMV